MWGEAVLTSNYIMNRGPIEGVKTTPAEMWYGKITDVSNLKAFRCISYNHIRKELRDKFDSKVDKCIMVDYIPNSYRLWDVEKSKIIIARDVKFNENSFYYKNIVEVTVEDQLEKQEVSQNLSQGIEESKRESKETHENDY